MDIILFYISQIVHLFRLTCMCGRLQSTSPSHNQPSITHLPDTGHWNWPGVMITIMMMIAMTVILTVMTGSTRTGAGLVTAVQTVHGAIAHPVLGHTPVHPHVTPP